MSSTDPTDDGNEITISDSADNSEESEAEEVGSEYIFGKWVVYVCAVVHYCLSLGLPFGTTAMFLAWQETFQVTRAHTAAVYSTTLSIVYGAAIIPGYLMNRFGARVTILTGTALSTTGCIISSYATSINYLIVTTGVIGGLGFCFTQLPSMPTINSAFTPRYRSVAVAICTCGIAMGNTAFPYLFSYLTSHYSWRETFSYVAGFSLHTAVLGLIMTSKFKRVPPSVDKNDKEVKSSLLTEELQLRDPKENGHATHIGTADQSYEVACENEQCEEASHSSKLYRENGEAANSPDVVSPTKPGFFHRLRKSKWKFLCDFMYILVVVYLCTCLATVYSFLLMMMDFARTKGFEGDGVFFLFIIHVTSLIGRVLTGFLNTIAYLHSITLMGIFGVVSSVSMMLLGSATDYATILGLMVVLGLGSGGIFALYTKSILDVDSVDLKVYPLALGTAGTAEGIFDFVLPILIGHAVDTTGSYTMIFNVLGGISLLVSLALVVIKTFFSYRDYKLAKAKAKSDISL